MFTRTYLLRLTEKKNHIDAYPATNNGEHASHNRMKRFKKDLIIFFGLLTLSFIIWQIIHGNGAIDIQLHDTYFVLDKTSLTILIMGPLTFLIFLARGLTRKFDLLEL